MKINTGKGLLVTNAEYVDFVTVTRQDPNKGLLMLSGTFHIKKSG